MKILTSECPGFGPLRFVGNGLNPGYDFVMRSNCRLDTVDLLIFLDSRGISRSFENSLAHKIISTTKRRFLCICRPLELTTWATLYNFLSVNPIKPQQLITNLGFVDFTPKKASIFEDARQQVEAGMGPDIASSAFVENYVSSSGEIIDLFSMTYTDRYRDNVNIALQNIRTYILNTPPLTPDIKLERFRPRTFFEMIATTNEFNRKVQAELVIDFEPWDETLTYDGVHFTAAGNSHIFRRIAEYV